MSNRKQILKARNRSLIPVARRPSQAPPRGLPLGKGHRAIERGERAAFIPPEDWHEPHGRGGDFRVVDGNAYTDNLKFSGPAAEIGVVGRTGLGARDYRQQIVVTTEPGNMLPTVAGILAGPGAGAALFVFTRLFKEPLKGIGRASYCLTGDWDAPTVEPIERDAPELALRCADLPDDMRPVVEE